MQWNLREKLDTGAATLSTRIMSQWPGVVELLGQTGEYDYVEFLAEYAPYDLQYLENLARTAELMDLSTMIKIDEYNREFIAQRALAAGIDTLLFAGIRSLEDAECAVNAVRAEPEGTNGVRQDRRSGYVGGYASPSEVVNICNDAVVVLMIEKKSCMDDLEEILAVDTIDMVQFGPTDYAVSLGKPEKAHSDEIKQDELEMIATAQDMGVNPRVEVDSPAEMEMYLDYNVKHFSLQTDMNILYDYWNEQGAIGNELLSQGTPR